MSDMGLVLGGGGAKGAYEIGAWKALTQSGLVKHIQAYAGASIGAINCALIQVTDSETASKLWLDYNLEKVFISKDLSYYEIIETIRRIQRDKKIDFDGLLDRDGLEKLFDEMNIKELEYRDVDFYASVVNITEIPEKQRMLKPAIDWYEGRKTGKTQYINLRGTGGDYIVKVLEASSSLPVIYSPVEIGGQYYVDGGVNDNLPITPLYQRGYRKMIVISCDRVNPYVLKRKFPNAEIMLIQPSRSLGSMLSGTLNFNKAKLRQSFRIGYYDAVNAINRMRFMQLR